MKQVIQSIQTGKLSLKEVPEPGVKEGNILVRTKASLISAGTERMVVKFGGKSLAGKARERPDLVKKILKKSKRDGIAATVRSVLAKLDEPLPLGYSASGEVVAVGKGLEGAFHVGQRVAIAGAGLANHAELNVIPANLASHIPDDVTYDEACFGTLSSIALHAVRNLDQSLGDFIAVIGAGLLGQLIINLLSLSGARVLALDYNISRLELAQRMGAEATFDLSGKQEDLEDTISALTNGRGMDGVIISAATKTSEPFKIAGAVARDRARICLVGMTGTEIPFRDFLQKELSLIVSRSYGPGRYDNDFEGRGIKYPEGWVRWTETENLTECLRLMSPSLEKRLNVDFLTTHKFKFEHAEKAYELVTKATEEHLGVVLTYGQNKKQNPSFLTPELNKASGCILGVIGAGSFARSILLPQLKGMKEVTLHTVVTQSGASAEKTRETFGFLNASTNIDTVLKNPDINAVMIATRHDSHADICQRALKAEKFVLVEKPLALSRIEINHVIEARNQSSKFFQVGFNRRYAPLSQMIRTHLTNQKGTKFILLRINAGHIPANNWIHSQDEGGGRILGEVCHFVDLARYFVGSPIQSVQADAARVSGGCCDDLNVTIRFTDGSLATIVYTGLGDDIYSKELIEVYSGGSVVCVDNFKSITIAENGKLIKKSSSIQDKGFKSSLSDFVTSVLNGGPAPINETELIETSLATIAIMESLREGRRIEVC